jgi:hypothetical protein
MDRFIITTDADTAFLFEKSGMRCISSNGSMWTFMNDKEAIDKVNMSFTGGKLRYVTSNKMMI